MEEFTLSEIASSLDVGERTLRRWSELFEQHGYEFRKRERSRIYSEIELMMFTQMKNIINGLPASEASVYVVLKNTAAAEKNSIREAQFFDEYLEKFEHEYYWKGKKSLDELRSHWQKCKKELGLSMVISSGSKGGS